MKTENTILVVDDESTALDIVRGFLAPEGYNLLFAKNADEAFSLLQEVAPDVILLDIMLPDVDGLEVCRQIKADMRWQNIPIILITALDGKANLEKGYIAGADDFLHKPINDYELRVRVRSMLRIKRQYDSLQNALQLREDLANMIVHDMRNPLAAIIGGSSLLKMKQLPASNNEMLIDLIIRESQQLDSFLNDMLMVAKQEQTGEMAVELHPIRLQSLMKTIESTHYLSAEALQVKLKLELKEDSAEIMADNNLLQRIIDNLISNAIKFSPENGTVTLKMETFIPPDEARPHLRLQITDEGPGIPENAKARIFDKFEVVTMKRHRVSQTGLGLFFCRLAVEAHHGRIWVEDNHPRGSIFTVEL